LGVIALGAGCAVEPVGYVDSGASVSVYGEYPSTYYGHRGYYPGTYHRGYYPRTYSHRYYAPYDRDHYLYRY
jgi:hypothetical protein